VYNIHRFLFLQFQDKKVPQSSKSTIKIFKHSSFVSVIRHSFINATPTADVGSMQSGAVV
jgi:hypothetical protein